MNADPTSLNGAAQLHTAELYFLLAKFLENTPCEDTLRTFRKELEEKKLLPQGKTWQGKDKILSFNDIVTRNPHISPDYLPLLCGELCSQLASSGNVRNNGHHSLIGNEIYSFIYRKKLKAQDVHQLVNQRYNFSTSHLTNSTPINQCKKEYSCLWYIYLLLYNVYWNN
jgi:hypothetical protein